MTFVLEHCPKNDQGHYLCHTKDGRSARIVCVDAMRAQPIVALIPNGVEQGAYKEEDPLCYNRDGTVSRPYVAEALDLVSPPVVMPVKDV